MHVFVTGATGWVGSAVVEELMQAGHHVTGLARSPEKAAALPAGVRVIVGDLEDHTTLRDAAAHADAVIHTAFNHDFSRFAENAEQDRRVIERLGDALRGTDRPLLVTSGLSGLPRGADENTPPNPASLRKSELAARAMAERGVRAATVRLAPSVHGIGDYGFVPLLIQLARRTGVSAYLGEGANCWSAIHRRDAARVYRLALEEGVSQAVYHAVTEEAIAFQTLADAIGRHLGVPVASRDREHFGWFAMMAGADMSASSARTHALLGWTPTGPGLFADLAQPAYFAVAD